MLWHQTNVYFEQIQRKISFHNTLQITQNHYYAKTRYTQRIHHLLPGHHVAAAASRYESFQRRSFVEEQLLILIGILYVTNLSTATTAEGVHVRTHAHVLTRVHVSVYVGSEYVRVRVHGWAGAGGAPGARW